MHEMSIDEIRRIFLSVCFFGSKLIATCFLPLRAINMDTGTIVPAVQIQHLCKIKRSRIIGGTQIITNKRKIHLFGKIIHFSMQFSAVLNIFIVKT